MKIIAGVLTAGFLFFVTHAYAGETIVPKTKVQQPFRPFHGGQTIIWELLQLPQGVVISHEDLEMKECEELKAKTKIDASLVCLPRVVMRQSA